MSERTSSAATAFGPIPVRPVKIGSPENIHRLNGESSSSGRSLMILAADLALVMVSLLVNLSFFAEVVGSYISRDAALIILPVALLVRGIAFRIFGVCERSFRHAGIADEIAIAKSVGVSGLILYLCAVFLRVRLGVSVPGSIIIGDSIILFLLVSVFHFGARIYNFSAEHAVNGSENLRRVLIIGAGDAGASVLKELLDAKRSGIVPVAMVDDDPKKRNTLICGVPVLGPLTALTDVLHTFQASEVLICIPSATQAQLHRILRACRDCGVPVRTLPSVGDLLSHRASTRDLRSVSIEDALQREQFTPDPSLTKCLVDGKVVLVTGAGGSIGSELCRQLAAAGPKRLILVDRSENGLFYCHMGIEEAYPGLETTPVLADVTDQHLVNEVLTRDKPDIVFHAAAFKHVGMMERHPDQAIRNNVIGTRNMLMASVEAGVEAFVNVSTDKAVNPRCFMGLSKKLTELLVKETARRHGSRFMNVRFGNVAGSTGSVLRIFSEQISKGKPIRVTDPHATRYFMSIAEAVSLILCAASLGSGGETFIFNMGTPVNIYELARTLSLFAGVVPGEELPIHFTGLRDGEKVTEELWEPWEIPQPTANPQVFHLSGSNPLSIDINSAVQRFQELLATHDQYGLLEYIDELVPTFPVSRMGTSELSEHYGEDELARAAQ